MTTTDARRKEQNQDAWELVDGNANADLMTFRLVVPGGWLYRVQLNDIRGRMCVTFLPDPTAASK